ncbi:hypothetical protein [Candidatus Venteria ishoeyi]|uniref:Uncharacterized protein n=1 Tax=Candidatus Venteria ishoeyi TaxID=1899563 RepID=A0A1H6F9J8_9GAMM|nr:hypothetical protein [Candidatus Venteria ishoeyi]SEH05826.1 Uncharacterised protein [Candidatus Venteria ishoeyi]
MKNSLTQKGGKSSLPVGVYNPDRHVLQKLPSCDMACAEMESAGLGLYRAEINPESRNCSPVGWAKYRPMNFLLARTHTVFCPPFDANNWYNFEYPGGFWWACAVKHRTKFEHYGGTCPPYDRGFPCALSVRIHPHRHLA